MATTGLRTAAFGLLRNHAAVHQHCHGAVRPASVVLVLQQQRQQQRQQHGRRSIVTACAPRGLAPYQQLRFAQTDSRDTIMSKYRFFQFLLNSCDHCADTRLQPAIHNHRRCREARCHRHPGVVGCQRRGQAPGPDRGRQGLSSTGKLAIVSYLIRFG